MAALGAVPIRTPTALPIRPSPEHGEAMGQALRHQAQAQAQAHTQAMTATVCPTPGCPNLEPCPDHPYTTWRDDRNGWAWRRLARRILARDHHRCRCGARATQVHHVVARNDGGTNDPANLRSLCDACHHRAHPRRYPY